MHTRIRRETLLFNAVNSGVLLELPVDKVSPRKYIFPYWALIKGFSAYSARVRYLCS